MDRAAASLPERMLEVLEGLLRVPAGDLRSTLTHACNLVATATGADKIDAFLYDATRDSLVAVGTSTQPMSALQRSLGLDVLPLSNAGRAAEVFRTGATWRDGDVGADDDELVGVRNALGTRSTLAVPLEVGGERRGVLLAASREPEFFSAENERMAETVARWIGLVAHRAELAEEIRRAALEQGRRAGAEELITVLAHDLRNQLAPMRSRLDVLARGLRGEDLEHVQALGRTLGRLERMMSDILDVARLDRGIFELEPQAVDLGALAKEVAAAYSVPEHPVTVAEEQGSPLVVLGDAARLRQCVENLVANAVQKSPNHAAVTIGVTRRMQQRREARVVLEVLDQGPGIPQEMLPHLFERFATSRLREGGLGLGLFLAKRIAAAHGGDLTARSEPGQGACFTLTLPAAPPAQGSGAAPRAARGASPRE